MENIDLNIVIDNLWISIWSNSVCHSIRFAFASLCHQILSIQILPILTPVFDHAHSPSLVLLNSFIGNLSARWNQELYSGRSITDKWIKQKEKGRMCIGQRLESELAKFGWTGFAGKDSRKQIWRSGKLHWTKLKFTNYQLQYLNQCFSFKKIISFWEI